MQEHVSEYGVHWNFFFTLMATSLVAALAPLNGATAAAAATLISVTHQAWLSRPHNRVWLESEQRNARSVLDANREGICSLPGYVALCYAGAAVAALLPPVAATTKAEQADVDAVSDAGSGSRAVRQRRARRGVWGQVRLHLAWVLRVSGAAVLCGAGMHAAAWHVQPVSRRFCNLAYTLWVAREGLVLLLSCWAVEACCIVLRGHQSASAAMRGISSCQLSVFLIANVLTGVVNMCMDTLHASNEVAGIVLVGYCLMWAGSPAVIQYYKSMH